MSKDISKLIELNDLVSLAFRRKHIIVLNPRDKQIDENNTNSNIQYDKSDWKIPDNIKVFVNDLSRSSYLSDEDKILLIYERLCQDYIYDDNLISYIQKVDDESFDLPDWYGRDVDSNWEQNRELHNRRVCYEVSRYLAESLNEIFKDNDEFNVCILWDKGLTHYFVALTSNDYSITLDLDDFNNIKDLTRVKAGLTAQGINILDDENGKFGRALDRFNEGKAKDAIKKIESEVSEKKESQKGNQSEVEEPDDVTFLRNAVEILANEHNLDSQGIYEYMKEIIDIRLGPERRKKVWKKLKGDNEKSTRFVRCLILSIDNQSYLVDVDEMTVRPFDEKEFEQEDSNFIPYKNLDRGWDERYDGS